RLCDVDRPPAGGTAEQTSVACGLSRWPLVGPEGNAMTVSNKAKAASRCNPVDAPATMGLVQNTRPLSIIGISLLQILNALVAIGSGSFAAFFFSGAAFLLQSRTCVMCTAFRGPGRRMRNCSPLLRRVNVVFDEWGCDRERGHRARMTTLSHPS